MAEPDCELCELLGYRACDECGGPTSPSSEEVGCRDRDLCEYCEPLRRNVSAGVSPTGGADFCGMCDEPKGRARIREDGLCHDCYAAGWRVSMSEQDAEEYRAAREFGWPT